MNTNGIGVTVLATVYLSKNTRFSDLVVCDQSCPLRFGSFVILLLVTSSYLRLWLLYRWFLHFLGNFRYGIVGFS